jgi:hypothetical protein
MDHVAKRRCWRLPIRLPGLLNRQNRRPEGQKRDYTRQRRDRVARRVLFIKGFLIS